MFKQKTRRLKVSDYSKLKNIEMLNRVDEEHIAEYLRISEDGNFLIYCKDNRIKKDDAFNVIGFQTTYFIYNLARKEYLDPCYCSCEGAKDYHDRRYFNISGYNWHGIDKGYYYFEFYI